MRVAFCIDNMNVGGTELNALRTARLLLREGVDLRVFSLSDRGPLLEQYRELGVPVHALPLGRLYGLQALLRGRELMGLVRRHRVQVVHAHDFYSNIFAGPWARSGGAAFIASRRWWEGPERRSQRWANRAGYVLAHRVLANSPGVAELLVREERVRRTSIVVVPNFLDDAAFGDPPAVWVDEFAAELGLPAERLVVGIVASLQPIKDHGTLLRAVALLAEEFSTLHAVLVGPDLGEQAPLAALARELGIADRVHFAGLRPQHPSPHHLFDVSCLTSVSEGLPNSLLEGMAAGRPVVSTRVGAVADAVVDGVTGWLVEPRDPPAVAQRLRALFLDPELRRTAGDAARERARTEYSSSAAMLRLLTLYRSLTGERAAAHANGVGR